MAFLNERAGRWSLRGDSIKARQVKQILFVETPELYHRPPESGDLQYESRVLKKAICVFEEGGALVAAGAQHQGASGDPSFRAQPPRTPLRRYA